MVIVAIDHTKSSTLGFIKQLLPWPELGVLACCRMGQPSGLDPWHEACDVCTPHLLPAGHSHPSFWGRGPSWAGRQGKSWVRVGTTGCGSIPCTPVMGTLVCLLLGCASILPAAVTTHRRCLDDDRPVRWFGTVRGNHPQMITAG